MTIGELKQLLVGYPDNALVVASLPESHMTHPAEAFEITLQAPLTVGNVLPGYIHVIIEPRSAESAPVKTRSQTMTDDVPDLRHQLQLTEKILRDSWTQCVTSLRRWARAFEDLDADTYQELTALAINLEQRADDRAKTLPAEVIDSE